MSKLSSFKVGIVTIIALVGIIYVLLFLKEIPVFKEKGYTFTVKFNDIGGMTPGSSVTLSGVKIGKVQDVTLDESGNAIVLVYVEKKYRIPKGSIFSIGFEGIIGQKNLTITPPEKITPGNWIKENDHIDKSVSPISLEDLASNAKDSLEEVSIILKTLRATITEGNLQKNIIDSSNNITKATKEIYEFTKTLKEIVLTKKEDIETVIEKAKQITENISIVSKKLDLTINSINEVVGDKNLRNEIKEAIYNIKQASERLNNITNEINKFIIDEQIQNDIKEIIKNSKEVTENSKLTVSAINKAVKTINELEVEPSFEIRYLPKPSEYQADIDLKLYPPEKKIFYLIGFDDVGEASKTNLQLGVLSHKNIWLRFGFKKGKLGAGFNKLNGNVIFMGDIINPNKVCINLRYGYSLDKNKFFLLGLENIFDDNFISFGVLQKY